jgi:cell division protein FtsB
VPGEGRGGLPAKDTPTMARAARTPTRKRSRRVPRSRILLRWLAVAVIGFIAFLYSQPLRSYVRTRGELSQRAEEVRALREEKQQLERRLALADSPETVAREARRLGYVKPGERPFIVKGIAAWRRAHAQQSR